MGPQKDKSSVRGAGWTLKYYNFNTLSSNSTKIKTPGVKTVSTLRGELISWKGQRDMGTLLNHLLTCKTDMSGHKK